MMRYASCSVFTRACCLSAVSKSETPPFKLGNRRRRPDPLLGTNLANKYKIMDKIGEGGMGSVYRAMQQPIDRPVAVKVLLNKLIDDDMAIRRFEQEARAVSKIQHPNTVTIYDYGQTDDGRFYLVMEFLKGRTLTELLREKGPVDSHLSCHVIRQVCASLGDAHSAGIIHRDLKPDNIFLTSVGSDSNFVKVLDFGVAKLADNEAGATLTQTGMIFGTPKYMSPEQAEGKQIDFRADIYAIGVMLYELLTGRPPFLADTAVALLLKHISQPPPEFERIRADLNVPAQLEAITMKALAKNVDERYLTVEDLAAELSQFMSGMSTGQVQAVGAATYPLPVSPAMPTEVVPNQREPATSGIKPPQAVPTNISLGVNPNDAASLPVPSPLGPTAASPEAVIIAQASTQITPAGVREIPNPHQTVPEIKPDDSTSPISPQAIAPSNELFLDAAYRQPKNNQKLLVVGSAVFAIMIGIFFVLITQSPTAKTQALEIEAPGDTSNIEAAADPAADQASPQSEREAKTERVGGTPKTPKKNTRKPPQNSGKNSAAYTKPAETKRDSRSEETEEETRSAQRTVRLEFSSSPSGALVSMDGRQLGTTPFSTEFAKLLTPVVFTFKLKGHHPREVGATLARARTVRADLLKKKRVTSRNTKSTTSVPIKTKTDDTSDRIGDADPLNERVDELKDF